jgi:hypothetical protein
MGNEFGSGNVTTKFYYYLDTDGSTSGGCFLNHDSSEDGFEFYVKSIWRYDNSTGNGVETSSVYRCSQGSWTKAEISVSSIAQKMCAEIQGGMVAFDKTDLEKYPSLYSAGSDMRVVVASANSSGDEENPSDWIEPGWATPGAVDFDLDEFDMFKFNENYDPCSGKQGQDKGYVEYGADCWTQTGCADYSCKGHPYCEANSYGVEAANFEDTRTPSIVGMIKEVYPDSAYISYFTDKPANGTLYFYGNDSSCQTLNDTILDRGILSSYVNQYKLWHTADIYNGTDSLNYSLENDTQYYYRLKVCDENGKCGTSKCSSFVTEDNTMCPFCRFVTRIKAPTGWDVYYDKDRDGSYEHWQGNMCGANAGMKTNYTSGRRVNIKLQKSDGSTYIEFINARLTKTGLNTKTRDIEGSGALKAGTTNSIGYTGMPTTTRDKIVNNLHPEYCRIKIPSSGSCSSLWHCDDDGNNCIDRTTESTVSLVTSGSGYCLWRIPCEFSVWAGGNIGYSGGDDGSPGGGSPSGGPVSTGGGGDDDKNATRRPTILPGVGLRNNTKLQAAMQNALGLANMSEQAKQNMLRISETISSQAQMQRNFRYSNGTSSMETRMTYSGSQRANKFMLYDTVPKDFAEHANNISLTSPGATVTIIESDPEYLFTYDQLDPGDEITITYSVDTEVDEDVIDSFSAEIYAQELTEPPACTDGATQCSLNDLQVCQDGVWVYQESCQYGCSGGACNTVPPAGIEDYALLIIAAIVVILIVAFLAFFLRKRSGSRSGPARTEKHADPLTPGEQPYRPRTY